jgi:hypothetical protein
VLTVRIPESEVARAMGILNAHNRRRRARASRAAGVDLRDIVPKGCRSASAATEDRGGWRGSGRGASSSRRAGKCR